MSRAPKKGRNEAPKIIEITSAGGIYIRLPFGAYLLKACGQWISDPPKNLTSGHNFYDTPSTNDTMANYYASGGFDL